MSNRMSLRVSLLYQLSCPESCRRGGLDVLKCRSHWEMNTLTSTLMAFQDFLFQGQPSCPSKPSPSVAPNAVDACWPFTQTTTNDELTYHFAETFLRENRKAVQLAQAAGSKKMPETRLSHRTLLIDTLLQVQFKAHDESEQLFSLTAYHLSNSGQGPKLDIYHLPLEITSFLREICRWRSITKNGRPSSAARGR